MKKRLTHILKAFNHLLFWKDKCTSISSHLFWPSAASECGTLFALLQWCRCKLVFNPTGCDEWLFLLLLLIPLFTVSTGWRCHGRPLQEAALLDLPDPTWLTHTHAQLCPPCSTLDTGCVFVCLREGWQRPIWTAMLPVREEEEEEMKIWGEDSSTGRWPWTFLENWAVGRCLCEGPHSWRGYGSTR